MKGAMWPQRYWEVVNEFFWVPSYLGLKSIPQKHWIKSETTVSVPRAMTNPSGPLYYRLRSGNDFWDFIQRQEETFNHVFNIAFSIAPGDIVAEIFRALGGSTQSHDYRMPSLPIGERYPWIGKANVTTPDTYFLATDSVLAVEIKFNARTSLDQLAKYVALIASEEIHGNDCSELFLFYIFPSGAEEKFERQTSIAPGDLSCEHFEILKNAAGSGLVAEQFATNQDAIMRTLSRLKIVCTSWAAVSAELKAYCQKLGDSPGDRCLSNLLSGLASEIRNHPLSGVSNYDSA